MNTNNVPIIHIKKSEIPMVYLDTCIMIELLRYENGVCKSEYYKEIEELYDILAKLIGKKKILCPLGHQLIEMGISEKREKARNFLYSFTNAQLQEPEIIEKEELDFGYQAYCNEQPTMVFDAEFVIEKDKNPASQFNVHVTPIYKKTKLERLKAEKKNTVNLLNAVKKSQKIAANLEQQLALELQADFQVFKFILEHAFDSEEALIVFFDSIRNILSRVGCEVNVFNPDCISAVEKHNGFLLSCYHHRLPYVWIQSVLWAHRMQQGKKIEDGDRLDTVWAAAYLPFIDYALTDINFCDLLQSTGLSKQYNVQVYSVKTLCKFISKLKVLL